MSNGESDAGWAMTIVSMFVIANAYTLFDLYLILTQTRFPEFGNTFIIAACGLILYFNYVLLLKDGKAQEILSEFQKTETKKGLLNFFLTLYIILTITLFIYTGYIVRSLNEH